MLVFDAFYCLGGDDVYQLCEAGEEEFLEIMALVGMAGKPLHVRRLQKALHEWLTNPGEAWAWNSEKYRPSRICHWPLSTGGEFKSLDPANKNAYLTIVILFWDILNIDMLHDLVVSGEQSAELEILADWCADLYEPVKVRVKLDCFNNVFS